MNWRDRRNPRRRNPTKIDTSPLSPLPLRTRRRLPTRRRRRNKKVIISGSFMVVVFSRGVKRSSIFVYRSLLP
jgi:hypothetical protein